MCSQLEEDTILLRAIVKAALQAFSQTGLLEDMLDEYTAEFVRSGASELHVIAAIIGGIAAQESIKLITSQFLPLNGSLIYNGIACTSTVLDL